MGERAHGDAVRQTIGLRELHRRSYLCACLTCRMADAYEAAAIEVERLTRDLADSRERRSHWYVKAHEATAARLEIERRLVALLAGMGTLPGEEADRE